ncbi:MAG: hypothetical protein MMC23_000815 [Stictis urceolatum]|nr:hypothetical protein [Stictis urceolata]
MLSAEAEELHSPPRKQRLSRSPHPYSRQSFDLPDRIYKTRTESLPQIRISNTLDTSHVASKPSGTSGAGSHKRSRLTTSPSDSGTEADDERPLLRAITAPPLRPRKGLRYASTPTASPLLTPSILDDEPTSYVLVPEQKKPSADEASQTKKIERNQKRRRYVVLRRFLETSLLGAMGSVSVGAAQEDYSHDLKLHAATAVSIYTVYIFSMIGRLLWINPRRKWLQSVQIPVAKDPAPILYPVTIPIFVALCSASTDPNIVLTNFVLSLCAIPSKAIPLQAANIQWLLSLVPLSYRLWVPSHSFPEETIALLFPLHHALLPTLEFLTTTSLLQTELQLLSISLINLLLFAQSPQALIAKSLLWVGGLTLLATCKDVLRWAVSLARVPSWRFKQVKHGIFKRSPILRAMDAVLGGWLSWKIESLINQESSDSDDGGSNMLRKVPSRSHRKNSIDITFEKSPERRTNDYSSMVQGSRQRRYTLPTAPSAIADFPHLRHTASLGLQKLRNRPKSFQALTSAQAFVLKWLYAAYTYFVILATIIIPVRIYIGRIALSDHEPFGWALGYLFGSIPSFRLSTVLWHLDDWIPLPLYDTSGSSLPEPATTRLYIALHIFSTLILGITFVLNLAPLAEVDTRRKLFHGMMVTMFLPTILIDPCFIALALSLALAVFLLLDLFRASQLPPLSRPLTLFLAPYVDGRDHRGPVIVSHIFLLIGCAIPLWLELAVSPRTGQGALKGWYIPSKSLGLVSGVICVGMGDAAASLVGRRFGRRRWPWGGGKSLEGSAAFACAVVLGLMGARAWMWVLAGWENRVDEVDWGNVLGKTMIAACGASFTEAVLTGANDNVMVPVVLWLLVKGLGL